MFSTKNIDALFKHDDGSLPDIFVENLTTDQVADIYNWIVSKTTLKGNLSVWSVEKDQEVWLPYDKVANAFNVQSIAAFRHGLDGLTIKETVLPLLTIAFQVHGEISFDYRMGSEWGEKEIIAFLELLSGIKDQAPLQKFYAQMKALMRIPIFNSQQLLVPIMTIEKGDT